MTDDDKPTTEDEFLAEAREKFELAAERENENRVNGLDDLKFARLGEQWPEAIRKKRELEGRPCLTINKLPTFIRQVVNDARQNKPAITVHPADSNADVETAEILSGLIRNIEVISDADVAYDTALEGAVSNGFGYFRINTAYTSDDTFDQDIVIERIANPFTVYGDPYSEAADSSDWNCAFVASQISKDDFERKYKDAETVDWDATGYVGLAAPWMDGDQVLICEYWHREEVERQVIALSNDTTVDVKEYEAQIEEMIRLGITPVGEPQDVKGHKVTQYIMTGAEVLETIEWQGKYIPIVPVYGDEINVEGKRYFRSLIADAKDPQREFNYARSSLTEMIGLAPKIPYIGRKGAFDIDPNWNNVNDQSIPYLEFDGPDAPQRQPLSGPPIAAMQQALTASDDMKAVVGLYDASLGARSNETSGKAIAARQREGDVSTFHFIDNLSRAIRHCGRILIDLIPKVYSTKRVVRVLGQDMKPQTVTVSPDAQAEMQKAMEEGQEIARIYDITAGKYDLTVKAGPSFSTQREETRAELVEIIRNVPESATILGPMYLRNSDWPGADKAADLLEGKKDGSEIPPEVQQQLQQMQQVIQQGGQQMQQLQTENEQLKAESALKAQELEIKRAELAYKQEELRLKTFEAQTDRIRAQREAVMPIEPPTPNLRGVA